MTRRHRFDLVVLDITLPGRGGIAWLRELRARGDDCEVVLITAFADLDTAIEALRASDGDFILKPFRVGQILNVLRNGLERSRLRRFSGLTASVARCCSAASRLPARSWRRWRCTA